MRQPGLRQQPDRGNSRTEATDGKGAGRNAAVKGKERVESMTFEDRLRERGLRYARFLGEKGQEDIYSFFDTLAADRGTLTETEMDALLKSYIDLGLIERNDGSQESREEAIRRLGDIKNTPLGEWVRDGYDEAPEVNRQGRLDGDYREVTGTEDREAKYKDNREGKSTGYREAENTDYREVKNTDYREVKDGTESSRDRNSSGSRQNPRRAADGTVPAAEDPAGKNPVTYTVLTSFARKATAEHPMMVLKDPEHRIPHHQEGDFMDPDRRTAFEYIEGNDCITADIRFIDKRFIKLLNWLGSGHIGVKLSGRPTQEGYAVYKIRAANVNNNEIIQTANNDFIQLVIRRMLASDPKEQLPETDEERDTSDATMIMTDMNAMIDYVECAEDSLPDNIKNWAHRNIAMIRSDSISQDEKRHAQRALSLMLNIQWKGSYFPSVDPVRARQILDDELDGMEKVKQRVIETIIQINRTHTLPAYGLLLAGPAGTGKSQIAYAVAKILHLPWTNLDMSAIHDTDQLTGTPRIYSNAKPGKIMEAFSQAGESNIVFIINELDKAGNNRGNTSAADALLTLLDHLGYTDNYIECTIPTAGVYPIATANVKSDISAPLLSRFAVIDIEDYTPEEKKIIFTRYSLPKILKRMGMRSGEMKLSSDAVDAVIDHYEDIEGVRELEQAAEHLAAHALYQLETEKISTVTYGADDIRQILDI